MRIIYLNLDRRGDRRVWMEQQAAALGLSFERFPAIDGNEIEYVPVEDSLISAGAYACFLGHRAIWESIAAGDEPFVVVLEDDVHMSEDAAAFLRDADWIPTDADLIHLEWERSQCLVWSGGRVKAGKRTLYRLAGECAGAAAYVISKRCAQILSDELTNLEEEFDHILFSGDYVTKANVLKLHPAIAIQDGRQERRRKNNFGSDNRSNILHFSIEGSEAAKPKFSRGEKLAREARRIIRIMNDRIVEMTGADKVIRKKFRFK